MEKTVEALKFLKTIEQKSTIKHAIPDDQLNKQTKNKIEKKLKN